MKEMGGYIELDQYRQIMMHDGAIALNCGRNCLAYLIRAKEIRKIALPYFLCDSIKKLCEKERVQVSYYEINRQFLPQSLTLDSGEWLYLVNYYGQLSDSQIAEFVQRYPKIIVDQAHAYYQKPQRGVDTIYTCRKFFGVADGGFLYTDIRWKEKIEQDESFERMHFLLGRYERTANEFYSEYSANNRIFTSEPIKRMSRLTENLLHGIDYEFVKRRRTENFAYLAERFHRINKLNVKLTEAAYMYPLYLEDGAKVRRQLLAQKMYIPVLWPGVLSSCQKESLEYHMAENILPLPVDQRYDKDDMEYLVEVVRKCIG